VALNTITLNCELFCFSLILGNTGSGHSIYFAFYEGKSCLINAMVVCIKIRPQHFLTPFFFGRCAEKRGKQVISIFNRTYLFTPFFKSIRNSICIFYYYLQISNQKISTLCLIIHIASCPASSISAIFRSRISGQEQVNKYLKTTSIQKSGIDRKSRHTTFDYPWNNMESWACTK
jgi:hypothetical protein